MQHPSQEVHLPGRALAHKVDMQMWPDRELTEVPLSCQSPATQSMDGKHHSSSKKPQTEVHKGSQTPPEGKRARLVEAKRSSPRRHQNPSPAATEQPCPESIARSAAEQAKD